jgi:hypothetical protein
MNFFNAKLLFFSSHKFWFIYCDVIYLLFFVNFMHIIVLMNFGMSF